MHRENISFRHRRPFSSPRHRRRPVLLEWRGMILCGELGGYEGEELTVYTGGFVPPRGSRVALRRPGTVRTGQPHSVGLWLVEGVERLSDGGHRLILVRGRGLRPSGTRRRR